MISATPAKSIKRNKMTEYKTKSLTNNGTGRIVSGVTPYESSGGYLAGQLI